MMTSALLICLALCASWARGQSSPPQALPPPDADLSLEAAFQEAAQTAAQEKKLPSAVQATAKAPAHKKFPKVGKDDLVPYEIALPCKIPVIAPLALPDPEHYLKTQSNTFHTQNGTLVRISANKDDMESGEKKGDKENDNKKGWFLLLYIESKNQIAWAKADPDAGAPEPFRINTAASSEILVLDGKKYFLSAGIGFFSKMGIVIGAKNLYRIEFTVTREGDPDFEFTSTVGGLGIDMQNTGPAFRMLGKTYHAVYTPVARYDRAANQFVTVPDSHNLLLNVYNTRLEPESTWYEEDVGARIQLKRVEAVTAPRKESYLKRVAERLEGDRKIPILYGFHVNEKRELEICDVTSPANSN
ncbi:MAG: hypothetical protein HY551_04975 [Elusimicrobia bacterium]|nr:hypothetical protein [Elusimicrobiota bacterium]